MGREKLVSVLLGFDYVYASNSHVCFAVNCCTKNRWLDRFCVQFVSVDIVIGGRGVDLAQCGVWVLMSTGFRP